MNNYYATFFVDGHYADQQSFEANSLVEAEVKCKEISDKVGKGWEWKVWQENVSKEWIKREMSFRKEYMSCARCACCYGEKNFCQVFSICINPTNEPECQKRAKECPNWVPEGADRSMIRTPDVERWYEKDSMA